MRGRRGGDRGGRDISAGPDHRNLERRPILLSGCILNVRGVQPKRRQGRRATRMQNFPLAREVEHLVCRRKALMAHVIELNPVRRRLNFLQPEGVGRKTVQPRSPIGCPGAPGPCSLCRHQHWHRADLSHVEIQQGLEIAPPAGIEPIHDDGDLGSNHLARAVLGYMPASGGRRCSQPRM